MDKPRLRVAVIDDDESVRRALSRLVRAANHDATAFASGREFLDSLASGRPDCIVIDLHMPGMSGLDLQKQLAKSGIQIPTVVITGHDEPETRAKCLSAGAAAYLRKPLDEDALLKAIRLREAASLAGKVLEPIERLVLPAETIFGIALKHIVAAAVLLALCLAGGLIARTRIGTFVNDQLERLILRRMPGFTLFKSAAGKAEIQVALVRIDEAWLLSFTVERHASGLLTHESPHFQM